MDLCLFAKSLINDKSCKFELFVSSLSKKGIQFQSYKSVKGGSRDIWGVLLMSLPLGLNYVCNFLGKMRFLSIKAHKQTNFAVAAVVVFAIVLLAVVYFFVLFYN